MNYNIFTSESPTEVLQFVSDNGNLNLIIADQRMRNDIDVIFLKKVQEIKPKPPPCRIIVSAHSDSNTIDEARE